jgi:hypothetical protein
MKSIFKKKSDKQNHNIIGKISLNYEDFVLTKEDSELCKKMLKKYRNEFKMKHDSSKMINILEFGLYTNFMNEIFNFYNNDICIEIAKIYAMTEGRGDYNLKIIMNLIDTVTLKICSCWEYIFQILNQYFSLELTSLRMNKNTIDKMYEKKMIFVKQEKVYNVKYVEWSEEERNELEDILKKKKKVVDVRGYGKKFKKEIKDSGFIISDRVNHISKLYSSPCVKLLKEEIRNIITHKKSATFGIAVGDIDGILPMEGIAINREGWIKIDDFKKIVSENLEILKLAIQTAFDIICLEDKLVSIGNEGKEYRILLVECDNCHHSTNITSGFYALENERHLGVKCSKCGTLMEILEEGKISEYEHNQVWIRQLKEYFGKLDK